MGEIRTLFFDIGGVLLTNGWDRHHRRRVIEEFDLDWDEFEDRHVFVAHEFEAGGITLDSYLDRTVFYRSRSFTERAVRRRHPRRVPGTAGDEGGP